MNLCHQGYRMEQNSEILLMRHPFWGFRNRGIRSEDQSIKNRCRIFV